MTTETLSLSGRVIERQVTLKATSQVLDQSRYGYDGPGDNPAYELTPTGALAATFGPAGATHRPGQPSTWPVTDIGGHVVAVVSSDGTITPAPIADEFGVEIAADTRDPAKLESRHGWLGAHQRPAVGDTAGVIRMGVRLYHPGLGRFLQVDPVEGGSANDYDYCNADPVGCLDLDGRHATAGMSYKNGVHCKTVSPSCKRAQEKGVVKSAKQKERERMAREYAAAQPAGRRSGRSSTPSLCGTANFLGVMPSKYSAPLVATYGLRGTLGAVSSGVTFTATAVSLGACREPGARGSSSYMLGSGLPRPGQGRLNAY